VGAGVVRDRWGPGGNHGVGWVLVAAFAAIVGSGRETVPIVGRASPPWMRLALRPPLPPEPQLVNGQPQRGNHYPGGGPPGARGEIAPYDREGDQDEEH